MTDTSSVGQPASSGSFSALLQEQESWLRAAPTGSRADQTDTSEGGAGALTGDPLITAIALLSALPDAEPAAGIGAGMLQSTPGLRQAPGQSLGEMLPQTGKLLPPHAASVLSPTKATPLGNAGNPPALVHEQLAAIVPRTVELDQAAASDPRSLAYQGGGATNPQTAQAPIGEAHARAGGAAWPITAAIPKAEASVETAPATEANRAAVLSAAGDPRTSSDMTRGPIHSKFFAIEEAADDLSGKPKPAVATFQAIHSERWIGQGAASPDTTTLTRVADLQSLGSTTAAAGPIPSGLETVSSNSSPAINGQPNPLPSPHSKTIEAPFGSGAWGSELNDHVHSLARDGNLQRAELRLNPAHLGPVEVKLSVRGDETSITFIASEGVVREALQETLPRLRDLLTEQGLTLGQARVLDHSANRGDRQPPQGQLAHTGYENPGQADDSTSAATVNLQSSDPVRRSSLIDAYI